MPFIIGILAFFGLCKTRKSKKKEIQSKKRKSNKKQGTDLVGVLLDEVTDFGRHGRLTEEMICYGRIFGGCGFQ